MLDLAGAHCQRPWIMQAYAAEPGVPNAARRRVHRRVVVIRDETGAEVGQLSLRAMAGPRVLVSAATAIGLVAWACAGGASSAGAAPVAEARPACVGVQTLTYSAADQDLRPIAATQCVPIGTVTGAAGFAPRAAISGA